MIKALFLLIFNAVITGLLYPFFINILYKFSFREKIREDGPKTHLIKQGTPTMGGIAFVISVSILSLLFNNQGSTGYFLSGIVLLSGLFGLLEDLHKVYSKSYAQDSIRTGLNSVVKQPTLLKRIYQILIFPWSVFKEFWRVVGSKTDVGIQTHQKFIIQGTIALIASWYIYFQMGYDSLWLPLFGFVYLGFAYAIIVFFLFIIVLNSVAFTDGLDGLAGGLAFIAFLFFWVISQKVNMYDSSLFIASFLGALLPFMYFNIFPARIFMGNIGSHALGSALVLSAILVRREIALFLICAVFLADGISSVLQQLSVKIFKKRIFLMAPLHHHFELLGWVETKVTLRFYLVAVFFGFLGLLVASL